MTFEARSSMGGEGTPITDQFYNLTRQAAVLSSAEKGFETDVVQPTEIPARFLEARELVEEGLEILIEEKERVASLLNAEILKLSDLGTWHGYGVVSETFIRKEVDRTTGRRESRMRHRRMAGDEVELPRIEVGAVDFSSLTGFDIPLVVISNTDPDSHAGYRIEFELTTDSLKFSSY